MPAIEVGCNGVQPGQDVMDLTTEAGRILHSSCAKAVALEGGPQGVHYGVEVENPSRLWAFFEWDSIEQHESFAKSHGPEVVQDMPKILALQPYGFTKHVDFTHIPNASATFGAPVVEIVLAYFPPDASPAVRAAANDKLFQFKAEALDTCPEVLGTSYGWGVETDFPVRRMADTQPETAEVPADDKDEKEGERKGAVLMSLVGWPSMEAHTAFGQLESTKKAAAQLWTMEGLVSVAYFHVNLKTVGRE